ncbi:hypothetical protein [Gardnerella sp. DNF01199S]|uniref:hypothetical protein n=1 Tax=Gardnerella sp. DNF01199S TaxID=2749067 RepID=UPI003BABEFCF
MFGKKDKKAIKSYISWPVFQKLRFESYQRHMSMSAIIASILEERYAPALQSENMPQEPQKRPLERDSAVGAENPNNIKRVLKPAFSNGDSEEFKKALYEKGKSFNL